MPVPLSRMAQHRLECNLERTPPMNPSTTSSIKFSRYAKERNDPNADAQSELSPWLNHGQISAQRCLLHASQFATHQDANMKSFVNEAIIWREMSDNFCHFNENYDSLSGAPRWAQETLKQHSTDERKRMYRFEQFEAGLTGDNIWNAAQLQLVQEGKMHGFLRMYWAKKILEWSARPEEALQTAIVLNDRYAIDGNDPNGYAGIMWSIAGVNDREFPERPIYGKVRFMTYAGCTRKFDVRKFVS